VRYALISQQGRMRAASVRMAGSTYRNAGLVNEKEARRAITQLIYS
jgi:hypothetical protein